MKRDPLQILGLSPNATKRDMKKSYRLLSKQFNPDLNPDDPEAATKFKEVQWAYEMLCGGKSAAGFIEGSGPTMGPPRDSAVWSEKPCVGYFWAWKVCSERIRAQNRVKPSRDDDDPSPEGND